MEVNLKECKSILKKYKNEKSLLIAILQDVQDQYKYLPQEALIEISNQLKIPLINIYQIATFYRWFRLHPIGKYHVTVCLGTACHVRGALGVLEEFERRLQIKSGEIANDMMFSLESVNCVGACALGPIVIVNNDYHGQMTKSKVNPLIKKLRGA
ncbi:MAG: NAD(P)H-dependent oxidoreductase subunit E [Acidobacteriota bacterium]